MDHTENIPAFIADIIRQCKTYPSRIAVIDRDTQSSAVRKTTYGEFLEMIERSAGFFKAKGFARGTFIVIKLESCMEYLALEYGAWLAGCAVVPVVPQYPDERISFIKEHCESPLIIDSGILEEIRKASGIDVSSLSGNLSDIAAIFYTSGSTGKPKGVMHTFGSLSRVDHFTEFLSFDSNDVFAYGAPFSFIAWILTVQPLRSGAAIRLIDRDTMTDIRKLQAFYDNEPVTAALITPSALRQLSFKDNTRLRAVLTGSERVSNLAPEGPYRLISLYGMTETALTVTFFDVTGPYPNTPIGKPLSDVEVKLMEDGEICVRGALTPGYYKDPERSSALWEGGWLHTGDIGRLLPDGNLEYVNRKDWMVKINGQRVETGEIIQVIKEMEGVHNATAKGFTAPDGHQYIVAYYVAEQSVSEDAIIGYLSGKLAHYMIPSYFVRMDSLPVNDNGKLDIKALQSPLDSRLSGRAEITQPQTEAQKVLCSAFETALGISPVGIDDDFFALGGDSIRVMQLQLACPQMDLSTSLIYKHRTVRRICGALQEETQSIGATPEICPLSQTQLGIYTECMNHRSEICYNNPFLYRLSSAMDAEKFVFACKTAIEAHPNVFASISVDEDGVPYQKYNGEPGLEIKAEEITEEQFSSVRNALVQPFDLLNDRLFRVRVFQTESALYLFMDFHHIIFDGSSNAILLADIEKSYDSQPVIKETFTGFDLAYQESLLRKSGSLEECRQWNLDTFCAADQTSLPDPDRFGDAVTFHKYETDTAIPVAAFAKASESLGVTENILAVGAFGYMLGACTHAKSSAFATIYNGRKSIKTSRTISMMVKTLPVYCSWDESTLTGGYFSALKDQINGSMAHDLFSFAEICSSTAYDSRVIFSYQDDLLETHSLCGSECETIPLLENATGEPFAVQLYKKNGSLTIRTEYRSNMYSEAYIRKFTDCFTEVLHSLLLADKDSKTAELRLVSEQEQSGIIKDCLGQTMDYDRSETFVTLFKKQVARRPEATAVVDENGEMSYAELDRKSDILASMLLREGVQQEDFVALMLPRLNLFPIAYIACFKSGAAYVPMDCEYPLDRLQYMLDDSQAKVLVTTREILEMKNREGGLNVGKVILLDDIPDQKAESIDRSESSNLAYMIYTSGTTGKPKGVMIEHHCLVNLVHWFSDVENIGPGSRIAQHASFSFDGSIPDLMVSLCSGAQLHILSASIRKDLPRLYRYFCENRIDGVVLTTQLGLTMLKMYDLKLRYLMLGGEKMTGPFNTKTHLYNGYGPTEFTVCSSYYLVDGENVPENIPIGRAVPNTLSAVVDSLGRLLPRGIAGELVLVGEQISRGYWHRDDITAARFVPCPFLSGQKMYRTGDLVKLDENNELLFLGRIDSQVKLRGFRIELGEIESTLSRYEGVQSAVVAVKEVSGTQHLCAYYCSETELDNAALRDYLASSLTDYMVPTAYVRLDTMPLTPNGKVDIKRLPVPEIKAEEIVPPSNETEEILFRIFADNFQNEDFGVTTNLISMGLTSLGAITVSLQLERKAGLNIPSSKILEHPTIRGIAELAGVCAPSADAVAPYPAREYYPLTDNQTGVYIDWEQHKDSTQYNIPLLLGFRSSKQEIIVSAVKAFVEAHPYLKTHLASKDGQVVQLRNDDSTIEVEMVRLDSEPDMEYFGKYVKPFNLFEGPLCRFTVFSFDERIWLLSDVHHIIFDGGSEAIFTRELIDACNGAEILKERFSAFDYSLYYEDWKNSEEYSKAGQYFESLLSGTVAASLPYNAPQEGSGVGKCSVSLDRKAVREMSRAASVTENALFLTAVCEVIHRFSREDNIALLTVSGGRSLKALERTAGMFVQTLPIVSHTAGRSVRESLSLMHNQIIETLARDKYPYTKIVEKTGVKPGILVAYQGDVLEGRIELEGKPVQMNGFSADTAKFPLSINIVPGERDTELTFEYDKAVFYDNDMREYAEAVKNFALNMMASGLDTDIHSISCVSDSLERELVALGSGPALAVEEDATLVTLFSRHAASFPDDTAVCDISGAFTYSELDRASDRLAHILLANGVRKESFVGIMLPRRKEFVLSFLAVYKSGGAYVPMDYEYPFDRLQYMLEDSMAKVLITTREILDQKKAEGNFNVENIILVDELDLTVGGDVPALDNSVPSGLAYMIYTSGTTGKPKGVMMEHRAVMSMLTWYSKLQKMERGTRVASHASFSFDASVLDLMTCIACGGVLYIMDEKCRKDPEDINNFINDNKIEAICLSTQLGMMLLSSYKLSLRFIMMGGEKLTGRYGSMPVVVNGYGPTEFAVCSSYHIVDSDKDGDNIPIGKAVPNSLSAVVDPCGRLLPEGVPGELVLVGNQIARGYWNKEEITRKRFVDCPFAPGQKMYHTGDLVKWNDDKELLFIGRIDTQVKLRGFRIELGEIESTIASFKDVTAAVAQVKEVNGVQHLCAYFTASSSVDCSALKAHLASILTSYMVPDSLMQLDALPLTPNGKVDTKKLPLPEISAHTSSESFEAPQGELEKAIADAFATALGCEDPIGRNSSFFSLGGTSLLVMKVVVTLSGMGRKVTYGDVFKYPTPATLAAFLEGVEAGAAASAGPAAVELNLCKDSANIGPDGYDYTSVDEALSCNTVDNVGEISSLDDHELGDVLLLGSTGYLGIHVLQNLLENGTGKVYCVIRPKGKASCGGRLRSYLMYYFDKTYAELFDSRLFVIEGDMTDDDVMEKLLPFKVDTVINCAANVKHFAAGDEIEKINLGGTLKLIDFCLKTGCRLVQTSTHSISGQMENSESHVMLESELYFGQTLMTKYQKSKFLAERAILEACNKGLKAKIMRLGNLMPRFSDGEFQINLENNGFMSRMRAYYLIGCIASSHLHSALEFAPIDATASAILTLARTPDKFTVFHPFNNHTIYIDDVIAVMRSCGLGVRITDNSEFSARLNTCLQDDRLNPYITTLLAYGSHNNYVVNSPSLDFTVNVLNAMDWRWPVTGSQYLTDSIEKMKSLEFFNK